MSASGVSLAALHQCRVLAAPWPGVHGVLTDSARHFRKHSHATFGIGLLDRGAHRSASGRGEVDAVAGDLLASNPGEVHDGRPIESGQLRRWQMVHLEPDVLAAMAGPEASSAALEFAQPVFQDERLRAALRDVLQRLTLWNAGRMPADTDLLACEESLVLCCGLLLDGHTRAVSAPEAGSLVERVRERLADESSRAPGLAELAAMVGLSKYQLLRRFAHAYGMPPHAWLLQQRAEHARRLIRDGHGLVPSALASGFADQSHMTRIFSRQFGFTPGAWQQAARRRPLQ